MKRSPFGYIMLPWLGRPRRRETPSRTSVDVEGHAGPGRGAVPRHERFLLVSVLAVVAAWILFRLLLMFPNLR